MQDGQTLFTILYRSWSHNAVATFSLCLLAQAYEQACSLLQILCVLSLEVYKRSRLTSSFDSADLEITVSLLIQIDKLVQLLESPVFTCAPGPTLLDFRAESHLSSPATSTPGAGPLPIPPQGDVRPPHAPAPEQRLRHSTESTERRQFAWFHPNRPQVSPLPSQAPHRR